MRELSGSLERWSDTFFFRRTPEELVFIGYAPWMFGPRREYKVSDAQAERLRALIHRVYDTTFIVTPIAIVVMTMLMSRFVDYPIAMVTAAFTAVILVVGVFHGMLCWSTGRLLAGISWTEGEPFSFVRNLKKQPSIFIGLSTPILIVLVVVALIGLPMPVIDAYEAFASGRTPWNVLVVLSILYVLVAAGSALVQRLNIRSAK